MIDHMLIVRYDSTRLTEASLIAAIDKAAKRGIIHRNAANRRKSRLNKLLGGAAKK